MSELRNMKLFEKAYKEAVGAIERFLIPTNYSPPMDGLVRWMLTTDANPHSFLQEGYGGALSTAEDFAALLGTLHHALYDDGDVTFVTVDGEPRIVFAHEFDDDFKACVLSKQEQDIEEKWETNPLYKGRKLSYDIQVLPKVPNDFGPLYDAWHSNWIKECFLSEVRRGDIDIEWTAQAYRKHRLWNEQWVAEARRLLEVKP